MLRKSDMQIANFSKIVSPGTAITVPGVVAAMFWPAEFFVEPFSRFSPHFGGQGFFGAAFRAAIFFFKWLVFFSLVWRPMVVILGVMYAGALVWRIFARLLSKQEITTNPQFVNILALVGVLGALLGYGYFFGG